jgi:hypothetical protein
MSVLFPKTYSYKPFNTAGFVKGRYQATYSSVTTFIGDIQPVTQEEIRSLNIGRDTNGMIKIFTDKVFNISQEGTNTNGDLITYDGKEYEVIKKSNWTGNLLPHTEYFAEFRKSGSME